MGLLMILSGPSGVGKTSLAHDLCDEIGKKLRRIVTITTRPRRDNEVQGIDYCFADDVAFDRYVRGGRMAEHSSYGGYRYGTDRADVDRVFSDIGDGIVVLDVYGAARIRDINLTDTCAVYLLPPSLAAIRERLEGRPKEDVERRVVMAQQDITAFSNYSGVYDYTLINDDYHDTLRNLYYLYTYNLRKVARATAHRCRGLGGNNYFIDKLLGRG